MSESKRAGKKRDRKNEPKARPPTVSRRIAFSPAEIESIERMATIGLPSHNMGWLLNMTPQSWADVVRRDKAEIDAGTERPDNVVRAIQRGRQRGNQAILRTAMEMAVGYKAEFDDKGNCIREELKPNAAVLKHLLSSRCGQAEKSKLQVTNRKVVFVTQIGDDGVIRSSEKEEGGDVEAEGESEWTH